MNHLDALAAKAIEDPATLSRLTKDEIRQVLTKLLTVTGAVAVAWLAESDADHVEKLRASGDRLLDTKEMAARIGCSVATLQRGWKRGRYPFMLKDGGRLVGSEDGLGRWIANRIKRSA